MPLPSFIQEAETTWADGDAPKTTASFNVLANDILVAFSIGEGNATTVTAISGGTLTWTLRQSGNATDFTHIRIWTAVVDSDKSMTVTFTQAQSPTYFWGGNVLTYRASDGVGASAIEQQDLEAGGPSLNLTTTQANSAIAAANGDWNAVDGAGRVWRTNAGAFTQQTYARDATAMTAYGGYHANAGAVGTYAVGLSAPTGQKHSLVAVEIKGTAAAGVALQESGWYSLEPQTNPLTVSVW